MNILMREGAFCFHYAAYLIFRAHYILVFRQIKEFNKIRQCFLKNVTCLILQIFIFYFKHDFKHKCTFKHISQS